MSQIEHSSFKDPAPSRVSYRIHRLWLTPFYRRLVRTGVPVCLLASLGIYFLSDSSVRSRVVQSVSDMRERVVQRPEFQIQLMRLDGVSEDVAKLVREASNVQFPVSSFHLDLEALRERIEAIDAVESASIFLRSGGVLDVEIAERRPVVVWRGAEAISLLDRLGIRAGVVASRATRADLPLLAGEGAEKQVEEALVILKAADSIKPRLRGLLRIGERRWDLVLDRGQVIQLPEQNPVQALERVIALTRAGDVLARDIEKIDMRDGRRPTLRLPKGAVEELQRLRAIAKEEDV